MATRRFVREMVKEAAHAVRSPFTNDDIIRWIHARYPDTNKATINCHLIYCSINQPTRIHSPFNQQPRIADDERYDFLFVLDRNKRELYDPKKHGIWSIKYEDGELVVAKEK